MTPLQQEIHDKKPEHVKVLAELCLQDFFTFMVTVNPMYLYGDVHRDVMYFLSKSNANERQLALLPRGHLKSHIIAGFCAWQITRYPWTSIIYLASQEDLAKAQLHAIKQMMTSDVYTALWPEMFNEQGTKFERGVWSAFAFDVDHPERRARNTRDHTMQIKTVRANAQGLHCDGLIYDDIVVPQFADTDVGRRELQRNLSYYSSILNPGGWIKAVGTRYHPEDSYQAMIEEAYGIWDEEHQRFTSEKKLWEVMEKVVEDSFDRSGTGNFLWPRTTHPETNEEYGFDINTLAKIKAGYSKQGLVNFYAQYYNDPNAEGTDRIDRGKFQYYDPRFLEVKDGYVYYRKNSLKIYAAMDVAWTDSDASDYTAIAVIGIDSDGFIYVLDLDQFKTSDYLTYYERIAALQDKWGFRKMLVETNAGGYLVAQEIENFVRRNGGALVVDKRHALGREGSKQERWASVLEPRYQSKSVFHRRGGLTQIYEDQLTQAKPRHDDLKDAVCSAIGIAVPPMARRKNPYKRTGNIVQGRFGGRVKVL